MTTPPKFLQLFTKSPAGYNGYVSVGLSIGRLRQQEMSQGLLGTFTILPIVEAWPYASDSNGQAYPAGLVAVRQTFTPSHWHDYTNSRFDIIPVPSTLPAGYTARWERAHNLRPGTASPQYGQGYFVSGFQSLPPTHPTNTKHYLRLKNGGIHYYYFLPEAQGDDAYSGNVGSSSWNSVPSAGLRYVQWKGVQPGITVELRCNANGSNTGTGDTSLASYTNGGGANADSPVFTAGLSFPLGVRRYLYFKINPAPPDVITLLAGPRVDIPLPWTCTGAGLIAPGGYVASALDQPLP